MVNFIDFPLHGATKSILNAFFPTGPGMQKHSNSMAST